ncbi:LAMI_0E10858g1_1 [Lachancea mirantina]|uniref:LAMI_0E10858g1_1 n=1 Tax=Lachancea mirantina TaxID=1230905 RepID=A0A1G4JP76_9SACH|nr:LAMI_0E10858g1_1 [Lachancea mirantina]
MSESGTVSGPDTPSSKGKDVLKKEWFQEAYKAACEFYEKDSALQPRDRLELSQTFMSITRAQMWGGWLGFATVFGAPFGWQYYKTNAIRGVRVPRNFVFGLLAMFATSQVCGRYMYKYKLQALDPNDSFASTGAYGDLQETPKSNAQRQYEMLKLLKGGMSPKWALYFNATYNNPERRFPNPTKKLEQMIEGKGNRPASFINQRDPLHLYSGPAFDKREGVPDVGAPDGNNNGLQTPQPESQPASSWEKIRGKSGFEGGNGVGSSSRWSSIRSGSGDIDTLSSPVYDPFDQEGESSQEEFDKILEEERQARD